MIRELFVKFWTDEAGAIIATEYLLLGSVVVVGGVSGMTNVRDAMNDEYKEYGNSVREIRQTYSAPAKKGSSGSAGGTTVINGAAPHDSQPVFTIPAAPTAQSAQITFSAP